MKRILILPCLLFLFFISQSAHAQGPGFNQNPACVQLGNRLNEIIDALNTPPPEAPPMTEAQRRYLSQLRMLLQINLGGATIVIITEAEFEEWRGVDVSWLEQYIEQLAQPLPAPPDIDRDGLYAEGLNILMLMVQNECPFNISDLSMRLAAARQAY